ncbi:MAG TPA: GspH/FimT family pseudopilin [Nitrospiria bacterium]|nr:GspH/FimT family pseudopilin [Nitrospiria bacterium]
MRTTPVIQQGSTLTELLIVMAVAGILCGLASVSFISQLPHHRLTSAARDVVSDLRWARQLALAERQPVSVVLDLERERYQIERGSQPGVPIGWVRDLQDGGQGFGGIDLVSSSGGPILTFYPQGTTNTWTAIVLRNRSGEQRQITVVATGRVKLT